MRTANTSKDCSEHTKKMKDWECMSLCIQKDITIYPAPKENSMGERKPDCCIIVNNNGKIIKSPYLYKQDVKLYNKINELYRYYTDILWGERR